MKKLTKKSTSKSQAPKRAPKRSELKTSQQTPAKAPPKITQEVSAELAILLQRVSRQLEERVFYLRRIDQLHLADFLQDTSLRCNRAAECLAELPQDGTLELQYKERRKNWIRERLAKGLPTELKVDFRLRRTPKGCRVTIDYHNRTATKTFRNGIMTGVQSALAWVASEVKSCEMYQEEHGAQYVIRKFLDDVEIS